ncbi:MAG TPA: hypothetical protein VJP78_14645, partial [Thermoleophilia bacterium]|nr:hypothetical protein [Thermoleophilia bacterium]
MVEPSASDFGSAAAGFARVPRYSIVVPIHNEADCLAAEVGELTKDLDERQVDYELILAENGSIDETPACCDALVAEN